MVVIYLQVILYTVGVFKSASYRVTPKCILTQVLTKRLFCIISGQYVQLKLILFLRISAYFNCSCIYCIQRVVFLQHSTSLSTVKCMHDSCDAVNDESGHNRRPLNSKTLSQNFILGCLHFFVQIFVITVQHS